MNRNAIPAASIHATILSILIGISSAYLIYVSSARKEIENRIIEKAQNMNEVKYANAETISSLSWALYLYLEEADTAPKWLSHRLHGLLMSDIFDPTEWKPPLGLSKYEETLCIICALSLRYPFPKRFHTDGPSAFSLNPHFHTKFKNIDEVRQWKKDFWEGLVVAVLIMREESTEFFNAMDRWSEEFRNGKRLFSGLKLGERLCAGKKLTPEIQSIPKEFRQQVMRMFVIYQDVDYWLSRLDELWVPPKNWILIGLGSAFIVFLIGVIYPLSVSSPCKSLYLFFPFLFYFSLFAGAFFWIWKHY